MRAQKLIESSLAVDLRGVRLRLQAEIVGAFAGRSFIGETTWAPRVSTLGWIAIGVGVAAIIVVALVPVGIFGTLLERRPELHGRISLLANLDPLNGGRDRELLTKLRRNAVASRPNLTWEYSAREIAGLYRSYMKGRGYEDTLQDPWLEVPLDAPTPGNPPTWRKSSDHHPLGIDQLGATGQLSTRVGFAVAPGRLGRGF